MPTIAEIYCGSKVSEIILLSEPYIQFKDAKNCGGRLQSKVSKMLILSKPSNACAVNVAKNEECKVESIRNFDTFGAFYTIYRCQKLQRSTAFPKYQKL
jgi:hypothetical protein